MANRVAGDLAREIYIEIDGQMLEIKRQLRQLSGYPFDMVALKRHLQNAVEGKFDGVAPAFVHDKTKDGWTLIENTPRRITSVRGLELVPFLEKDESYVNGEEMVRRARVELDANYGQEDTEYVLARQDEIPEEFRSYCLVFPGTVWRDAYGYRRVPYLIWYGKRWLLNFDWLRRVWYSSDRLVRLRK